MHVICNVGLRCVHSHHLMCPTPPLYKWQSVPRKGSVLGRFGVLQVLCKLERAVWQCSYIGLPTTSLGTHCMGIRAFHILACMFANHSQGRKCKPTIIVQVPQHTLQAHRHPQPTIHYHVDVQMQVHPER